MTRRNKPPTKLLRSLYIWHRYLGLSAALFVILLAVTGLILNHTDELQLDSRHVQSNLLLDWYGIHAPQIDETYQVGTQRITQVGTNLYLDTAKIHEQSAPLIGAVLQTDLLIVGLQDRLLLFTRQGELLETLDATAGVPTGILALGIAGDGSLALRSTAGVHRVDADFLEWQHSERPTAAWVTPEKPPQQLVASLQASWRGNGLPLERVLLDLHSGRLFGRWGVYLMDAAAILFVVLAGTGIWLWGKRRASARQHARARRQSRNT